MTALNPALTDWLLVTVTLCGALVVPTLIVPNDRLFEEIFSALVPMPLRLAVGGLPLALSDTERMPVRDPPAVGKNVTAIVQFLPAPRLAPQLFVCEKLPLVVMFAMVRLAFPLLFRLMFFVFVFPTDWELKFRPLDESEATGVGIGVAVAVRVAVAVFVAVAVAVRVAVGVAVRVAVAVLVGVAVFVRVAVGVGDDVGVVMQGALLLQLREFIVLWPLVKPTHWY
jgi:hypothetical protein